MARVIDKLPPVTNYGRPRQPSPVQDQWTDGRVWAVLAGEDYRVSHKAFASAARVLAGRQGKRVSMRRLVEGDEQVGWAIHFSSNGNGATR